jgi:hypothetical protein
MSKKSGKLERGVSLATIAISVLFFGLIIGAPQVDDFQPEIELSPGEQLCGAADSLLWEENVPGFSIVESESECINGAQEAREKLAFTHSLLEKRCETNAQYEWRTDDKQRSSCVPADDKTFAVSIKETRGACCRVL